VSHLSRVMENVIQVKMAGQRLKRVVRNVALLWTEILRSEPMARCTFGISKLCAKHIYHDLIAYFFLRDFRIEFLSDYAPNPSLYLS
jgi:hypothetical protein